MTYPRNIETVIFDMDGLLIDSEPLWQQAEAEVLGALGVNLDQRESMPHLLGLRIDLVVSQWYAAHPWQGESQASVSKRIIDRVIEMVHQTRPLLPGVQHALELCRQQGLKIGLASASPLYMQQQVLSLFDLSHYFDHTESAEHLPYSKPHPEVYLKAAAHLDTSPLRCITLEDSFNGMVATKAARMHSIVVPAHEHQQDARWSLADYKLGSLLELNADHLR